MATNKEHLESIILAATRLRAYVDKGWAVGDYKRTIQTADVELWDAIQALEDENT
jgi:hypothetical protein